MNQKLKVCMIGATAVGKTSLVVQFVSSIFRERYSTTIGVKIHARRVQRGSRTVDLILWDLSGEDEFQSVQPAYLRGASGYLLVADGTRRETLDAAIALQERAERATGGAPFLVLLNKSDLERSWEIGADDVEELSRRGWPYLRTSAKTGETVEAAFEQLTTAMLDHQETPWT